MIDDEQTLRDMQAQWSIAVQFPQQDLKLLVGLCTLRRTLPELVFIVLMLQDSALFVTAMLFGESLQCVESSYGCSVRPLGCCRYFQLSTHKLNRWLSYGVLLDFEVPLIKMTTFGGKIYPRLYC